jgi:hypothetical protein
MNTIIANLRHAARNGETVVIGGGEFGPAELRAAADAIERDGVPTPPPGYTADELERDNPYNQWMQDVRIT